MKSNPFALALLVAFTCSSTPSKPSRFIRPTDANTGHTTETHSLLTPTSYATSFDNQIISGYLFAGSTFDVLHDNVTVTDCLFVDAPLHAANNRAGTSTPTTGLRVSDSTFESSHIIIRNGIIEHCEVSSTNNFAVEMNDNSVLRNSWVHDMAPSCSTGSGSSCLWVFNGVTGVTIEGNLLDPGYAQEAAISVTSTFGSLNGVTSVSVHHNWIDSGRYLLLANTGQAGAGGSIMKLSLTDNLMGTDYKIGSSWISPGVLYEQSGNTWYGTGLPYTF